MSTQPFEPVDIVLRGPKQVAASVPYLLGFRPTDSIVAVFTSSTAKHVLTARVDLPTRPQDLAVLFEAAVAMCAHAELQGAKRVNFVLYPSGMDSNPDVSITVGALRAAAGESVLQLESIATVHRNSWRDELDPAGCASDFGDVGLEVEAQWGALGVSYDPSRLDLAARVDGPATELADAVADFLASQPVQWRRDLMRNVSARRVLEEQIVGYLSISQGSDERTGSSEPLALPAPELLAAWAIAVVDSRVREPLLWRLANGISPKSEDEFESERRILQALCALVRNVPREVCASLASCLAAYAWQLGNGALARIAADHGLAANPENVLCRLVSEAVGGGVHPQVWLDMLATMSLKELRSGPRRRRSRRPDGIQPNCVDVRDCPG